ncbi:MAG: DUF1957 domain-containing protein [Spartobacteria bacterium]|nr:DUF1957 domain-containing protein [Spartobacteria bacterium]
MTQGYISILLHAHLPFVRHPEYERFLEENWYFEAVTETYIPLLRMFRRLRREAIPFRLTVSLSPTLLSLMTDVLMGERYIRYLKEHIQLAERELRRTRGDRDFYPLAVMYSRFFRDALQFYESACDRDLVGALVELRNAGRLELITCAATHGYLPLLRATPSAVRAQVLTGVQTFLEITGSAPEGIWLPECGYYPGLEETLKEAGLRYFTVEEHGITNATPRPKLGLSAPVACPNGVAAFGRDPESSRQVWSSTEGYPGDFAYRDFYRDIGYDLDIAYIRPYILDGHTRISTGFKYYRITGASDRKKPYHPAKALQKVREHARHFLQCKQEQVRRARQDMTRPPLIHAPFDAELYGHWWFEGPAWLEAVIRETSRQTDLAMITPGEYLRRHPVLQEATPSASSWGYNGYNECWLNSENDYLLPLVHAAGQTMCHLAERFRDGVVDPVIRRALNQAGRNLLLVQASDWAFIMKTGSSPEYARKRVHDHLARFHCLATDILAGHVDEPRLCALEALDPIFPSLDYRIFCENNLACPPINMLEPDAISDK